MDDSSPAGLGHNHPPTPTLVEQLTADYKSLMDRVEELAKDANSVKALVDAAEQADADGNVAGLTDELVEKMVEVGKKATKLAGSSGIDSDRTTATKSRRDEIETINGFFNTMKTRVERIKGAFAEKVGAYNDEKRARDAREAAERARLAQEEAAAKLEEAQNAQHSVLGDVVMNEAAVLEEAAQKAAREAVTAGTGPTRTAAGTISSTGRWTAEILDASKIPLEELRHFIKLADLEKFVRAYAAHHKDSKPLPGVRIFRDSKTSFR
jgi:DNA repair exonuclease SbcCD ATPase subunit